jgi:tricarballylate dehydrogenase
MGVRRFGGEADVIVVGGGNAAFCAALAAQEAGARVILLERASLEESGGNTRFTSGSMRFAFEGFDDLSHIMPDLSEHERATMDFGSYTSADFFDDMFRVTEYRTNPDLCECLVARSLDTMKWLSAKGVRFLPKLSQSYRDGDKIRFVGGVVVEAAGGGDGLIDRQAELFVAGNGQIHYNAKVVSLLFDGSSVEGVKVRVDGVMHELRAKAVVLACGGFEANPEWRSRYLGPGWDLVKVRGSRFNTGDGLRMALDIGASAFGNWTGCHSVGWDANAPEFGDLEVGALFQKHSYPIGVMINARGRRFVDEGADLRQMTYAKYGRVVMEQPGQFAWQIFDNKVTKLLRPEYRIRKVTKVSAGSLEELAQKLEGVDQAAFLDEIASYNRAVADNAPFNPSARDGRTTHGLSIPKSNWANTIDEPPFEAYQVGCGITFTFGGLRIDPETGRVLDTDMAPISGLYAAGEMVGGIFYFNYPGGTGLMSGAVFGRIAGNSAAREE